MTAITKLLVFIFIFACLYIIRSGVKFFVGAFNKSEETPVFEFKPLELLFTGLSLSYVLTLLITGFGF